MPKKPHFSIFAHALELMRTQGTQIFGPASFQGYLSENSLREARTWQAISVDSFSRLAPELRAEGVMVFRLGASNHGPHTQFALIRYRGGWEDFFLIDDGLFASISPEIFLPSVQTRELFAFQLLPALTETSFVNLALASGLLGHALGLDDGRSSLVPATGQSTFSFDVRPREDLNEKWHHRNGQVEIDALFVGERQGKPHLFIVEAKASKDFGSLAKHKLVYPMLALRAVVPKYLPLVPVYLRVIPAPDGLHFCVCECSHSGQSTDGPSVDSLRPLRVSRFVLTGIARGKGSAV